VNTVMNLRVLAPRSQLVNGRKLLKIVVKTCNINVMYVSHTIYQTVDSLNI
jgi:hypothetical protein